MIKVRNLAKDEVVEFDPRMTPLWGVVYCWCDEHQMLSALFGAKQNDRFEEFVKGLPVVRGKVSIGCGDWVALI